MSRKALLLVSILLAFVGSQAPALEPGPGAQASSASAPAPRGQMELPPTIQTAAEEVLLDIVVRDRHGKMVPDLTPEEIHVWEDGNPQAIRSFRLVKGAAAGARPPTSPAQAGPVAEALRGLNLVTLVFERLDQDAARLARQAALDFLNTEKSPNVFMAVFTIDQRLFVVQPFTRDHALLRKAIEQATRSSATQLAAQSDTIQAGLEVAAGAANAANQNLTTTVLATGPNSRASQFAMVQAIFARMTANMLLADEALRREQEGRTTLYSLISLVREQRRLPGRKTILYITRGLQFTQEVRELLRTTVSEANRANVSFYTVDARGLSATEVMNPAAREIYRGAESASHNVLADLGAAANIVSDTRRDVNLVSDPQALLQNLAEDTGGFLLANSNDLRVGLRRVAEEIETYYELTYRPPAHGYDSKFHSIEVRARRPGLSVQTRSGYYAFPPMGGAPVFTYDVPMLSALASSPVTEHSDYRVVAAHFGYSPEGLQYRLLMDVPLSNFAFLAGANTKLYRLHFSLLALVKNAEGQVVRKFSQDFPLEGPLDQLQTFRDSDVLFKRDFYLPPGRYTLETVAFDGETKKASVRRSVLIVPSPHGAVSLSSITIVRRVEPLSSHAEDGQDPFRYQSTRIVPSFDESVRKGAGAGAPVYFVVYLPAAATEAPVMGLELVQSGEVVARIPLQLPVPDRSGSIPYVGTIPVEKLQPGRYEIKATVRQGANVAEEYAFFTLTP